MIPSIPTYAGVPGFPPPHTWQGELRHTRNDFEKVLFEGKGINDQNDLGRKYRRQKMITFVWALGRVEDSLRVYMIATGYVLEGC